MAAMKASASAGSGTRRSPDRHAASRWRHPPLGAVAAPPPNSTSSRPNARAAKCSASPAYSTVVPNATSEGTSRAEPDISSRNIMAMPTTGTAASAALNSIPGSVITMMGSVLASCTGVSAFCASLKLCERTAIPRNSAEKRTARGTRPTITSSAVLHGRVNCTCAAFANLNTPLWKVSSMLSRLAAAAAIPISATAANFPATISLAGTGAVSSVSSVPRSFSPAARSIAG